MRWVWQLVFLFIFSIEIVHPSTNFVRRGFSGQKTVLLKKVVFTKQDAFKNGANSKVAGKDLSAPIKHRCTGIELCLSTSPFHFKRKFTPQEMAQIKLAVVSPIDQPPIL